MIEEWVAQLSNAQLNDQCQQSGMDFFSFMTAKGINAGYLTKLITQTTGYNPRQLWTVLDAGLLRDAIFRYEASVAAAERGMDPKQSAQHFWGS